MRRTSLGAGENLQHLCPILAVGGHGVAVDGRPYQSAAPGPRRRGGSVNMNCLMAQRRPCSVSMSGPVFPSKDPADGTGCVTASGINICSGEVISRARRDLRQVDHDDSASRKTPKGAEIASILKRVLTFVRKPKTRIYVRGARSFPRRKCAMSASRSHGWITFSDSGSTSHSKAAASPLWTRCGSWLSSFGKETFNEKNSCLSDRVFVALFQ